MTAITIASIQVGLPCRHPADDLGPAWESAIFKRVVTGPVDVGPQGLQGDGQAGYGKGHGGPDRAVMGYCAEHYPLWRQDYSSRVFEPGSFGENLTISGIDEQSIFLGDRFSSGDVLLEVSVFRSPCRAIERRTRVAGLLEVVQSTGRIGWFYRVSSPGSLESGQTMDLHSRPFPQWSIATVFDVFQQITAKNRAYVTRGEELAACPVLPALYREVLTQRLQRISEAGETDG